MYVERPILAMLLPLVAGLLIQCRLQTPFPYIIPAFFSVCLLLVSPLKNRTLFNLFLTVFWTLFGLSALSPLVCMQGERDNLARFENRQTVLEGLVEGRPFVNRGGERLLIRLEKLIDGDLAYPMNSLVQLEIYDGQSGMLAGDRVRTVARIKIPRRLGLPGEFDYPTFLALRGVAAVARVKHADSVVLMQGGAAYPWRRAMEGLVQHSQRFIRKHLPDPEQRGVVLALASGDQHEIPEPLRVAYARSGVSHILSVSGFHVGIVVAVWIFALRWLLGRSEKLLLLVDLKRVTLLSALPLMFLYLLFTGAAPATARSVFMLAAVVLAAWSERESDSLDALLLAAFLLLLINPATLFDLSFQLSFLALWGLLVLTPLISAPLERFCKRNWQRQLLLFLSASLAAVLATAAPVLSTFQQLSFSGVIANLLVVPLLGYGATVLATLAVPLLFLAEWPAMLMLKLAGQLVSASNIFIYKVAELPVLHSFKAGVADLLITVLLLSLFSFVKGRGRVIGAVAVVLLFLLIHLPPSGGPDGKNRILFLSVGQGDATLIQLADGRNILVDGGGFYRDTAADFGERYLLPALNRLKIRKLDVMLLTHPHADHLGGLPAVAEQLKVEQFWQGNSSSNDESYRRLMAALDRQRTAKRTLQRGDIPLVGDNVEITVLAAPLMGDGSNEDSVVLRLKLGKISALLMADAGFSIEGQILADGVGQTTILKVGHHGSRSSTGEEFLKRVKPELAVISAGYGNRFRLPDRETINRLQQQGVEIFRTDQQGTVQLVTDGSSYSIAPLETEPGFLKPVRQFVLNAVEKLQ